MLRSNILYCRASNGKINAQALSEKPNKSKPPLVQRKGEQGKSTSFDVGPQPSGMGSASGGGGPSMQNRGKVKHTNSKENPNGTNQMSENNIFYRISYNMYGRWNLMTWENHYMNE